LVCFGKLTIHHNTVPVYPLFRIAQRHEASIFPWGFLAGTAPDKPE
jgi:hypothetical protein